MDLSNIATRAAYGDTTVKSQNEQKLFTKEDILKNVSWFNNTKIYKKVELDTMQKYCEKMWDNEQQQGDLTTFRKKLSSLFSDMKKYTDLRVACFDLITAGATDYQKVFSMFFELQALISKLAIDSNVYEAAQVNPDNLEKIEPQEFKNFARSVLKWHGAFYEEGVDDPEIKRIPHIPVTTFPIIQVNGLVSVCSKNPHGEITSSKVVCLDLSIQYIKNALLDKSGHGIVDMRRFSSEQAIAELFMHGEKGNGAILANVRKFTLLQNNKLDNFLRITFQKMQSSGEYLKAWLVTTHDHAMAIVMCTLDVFAITFYEPKKTNAIVHWESGELSTFKGNTIEQCITGAINNLEKTDYSTYYDDSDEVSMLYEIDLSILQSDKPSAITKKQVDYFTDQLTPTDIYYLINAKLADEVRNLHDQLKEIGKQSPERLLALLTAEVNGVPALLMAMHQADDKTILEYGKLLHLLPITHFVQLRNDVLKGIPKFLQVWDNAGIVNQRGKSEIYHMRVIELFVTWLIDRGSLK